MGTDTHNILHVLRNPYGYANTLIRSAAYAAASKIESLEKELIELKEAYENMRDFAQSSGLDTAVHNHPAPDQTDA